MSFQAADLVVDPDAESSGHCQHQEAPINLERIDGSFILNIETMQKHCMLFCLQKA